jgi:hypothetical protein
MSEFRPTENDTVLDIGVTSDDRFESANYFEQFYPFKNRITGLGLEDASYLESRFPGFRFVKGTATKIPFAGGSFDYVHSGAVIEHVGNYTNQCMMIAECCKAWRLRDHALQIFSHRAPYVAAALALDAEALASKNPQRDWIVVLGSRGEPEFDDTARARKGREFS